MRRAAALAVGWVALAGCTDQATPARAGAPDVRPELALLTAGLPLTHEEALCRQPDDPGCPHVDLRAASTASPGGLLTSLRHELRRQRWLAKPSSCRGVPRSCAITASKSGGDGVMTLNFLATSERPGATSVRISIFSP